ncbi:Uncharacterised protein [Halioglobus japonicus]|nr:Uncharacterised protein [Halioglobus japonicus]
MKDRIVAITAGLLGFAMLTNGTWQLAAPDGWFWAIPGVPDRGPFNPHFVRDLGIIYSMTGIGLILGALRPRQRFTYWWAPAFWLVGHALFHIAEVLVGICGPTSLLQDFAGVTLPAIISVALLVYARREHPYE